MYKHGLILLFILNSITNCIGQAEDNTLLSLFARSEINGLCGSGIELLKDSTYVFHTGCEQFVWTSLGTWSKMEDTITIQPIDLNNFDPIKSILLEDDSSDSTLSILVLDKNNKNVSDFMVTPLTNLINEEYILLPKTNIHIEINDQEKYRDINLGPEFTGNDGKVILEKGDYTKIKLSSLLYFNKHHTIRNIQQYNKIIVKLDIPKLYFRFISMGWTEKVPPGPLKDKNGKNYYFKVNRNK